MKMARRRWWMVGRDLQPTWQPASFGTLSLRFVFIVSLIFKVSPVFANVLIHMCLWSAVVR
ncbi:hypothetical protein HanOQP8_Chr06g0212861 [Helianthus annuus]|nr:hypothetical protein HanOQP8_Chr06g0212861 [Helianthus annuus]